jgi:WD40 repeat protein
MPRLIHIARSACRCLENPEAPPYTLVVTGRGNARALAFSPDGKTLATGGDGATIALWDVKSGKRTGSLQGNTGIFPKLQGVYAGQPGRKTDRPSAELLLRAMKTISVSVVEISGQTHALLAPLTEVQTRLLDFWGLPSDLYEKVVRGFPISPVKMSEP